MGSYNSSRLAMDVKVPDYIFCGCVIMHQQRKSSSFRRRFFKLIRSLSLLYRQSTIFYRIKTCKNSLTVFPLKEISLDNLVHLNPVMSFVTKTI